MLDARYKGLVTWLPQSHGLIWVIIQLLIAGQPWINPPSASFLLGYPRAPVRSDRAWTQNQLWLANPILFSRDLIKYHQTCIHLLYMIHTIYIYIYLYIYTYDIRIYIYIHNTVWYRYLVVTVDRSRGLPFPAKNTSPAPWPRYGQIRQVRGGSPALNGGGAPDQMGKRWDIRPFLGGIKLPRVMGI